MTTTAVIAKVPAQPGKRAEVLEAMSMLIELARSEDGTLTYVVHEDQDDPDVVWVYELYRDAEARDAHMNADAMKRFIGTVGGLLAGRAELTMLTPVAGKEPVS